MRSHDFESAPCGAAGDALLASAAETSTLWISFRLFCCCVTG